MMDKDTTKHLVIAFVVLNLVIFGVVLYNRRSERATTGAEPTGEAPGFSLPAVGSAETVALKDFRGKVVVLDFWATWCEPCKRQMPAVQRISADESLADDLQVVSVNTENSPGRRAKVNNFLKHGGYTFLTVYDDGRASSAYGIASLPTLAVITADGQMSSLARGVHSEEELRAMIDRAMDADSAAADSAS